MSETPSPASLEAARRLWEAVCPHDEARAIHCTECLALALESYAQAAVEKAVREEREECAKVADSFKPGGDWPAAAIRSRGRAQQ